jgi:hypothetical protein
MAEPGASYVRGAGTVDVDPRRLLAAGIWLLAAVLAVLAVVTTVEGVRQVQRTDRLRTAGVPVRAVVTGCVGLASGTGITVVSYSCRASFDLDGRTHNAVLGGSTALHRPGDAVAAVVLPADEDVLSIRAAVARPEPRWHPFVAPAVLTVLTAGLLIAGTVRRRRVIPVG